MKLERAVGALLPQAKSAIDMEKYHGSLGHPSLPAGDASPKGGAEDKNQKVGKEPELTHDHHAQVRAVKDGLRMSPQLKVKPKPPTRAHPTKVKPLDKTEVQKADEKFQGQSLVPSVFGSDRITISAEAQIVPGVTRKADAVGVKKLRGKYNMPGIGGLVAKATPKAKPTSDFGAFLEALTQNFS